jgi:D-arabinan exo alpha-(1,3)/(1,5)-arabinofuranosidase (non-reducing end)
MIPCKRIATAAFAAGWLLAAHPSPAQNLDDLLRLQHYTAHRASSSDPTGGNADFRRVGPGKTLTLAELEGPGLITHIWFTVNYPSRSALRKLVLRIYFDDLAEPCVEAPLGDFFGLGHALVYAYVSQPLAVGTQGGLNCYWPMPFAKKARLTVANEGAQTCLNLYYQVDYRKLEKPLPDKLHFFAAYRQAFPCEQGQPYVILQTDGGPGHYVGCNLSIEQREDSWWGEGDTRMYVDGQSQPVIEGTGSEDDFGGAWCYSHEFSYPQFGAPLRARFNAAGELEHCTPDLRGKDLDQWHWPVAWRANDLWNVYRYHIADPVPFKRSLLVNIEHGYKHNERSDWYSSVAYWYQAGRPAARPALPAVLDRLPYFLRPHDYGDGRWEGEDLVEVAKADGGVVQEAGMKFWGDLFSRQYALGWEPAKAGNVLSLPFTVSKPGRYKLRAWLGRVPEGGTFKLGLDELPVTQAINLCGQTRFPEVFETVVAEAELSAGTHVLKVISLEPAPKSRGKRFLLDKFQAQPLAPANQP